MLLHFANSCHSTADGRFCSTASTSIPAGYVLHRASQYDSLQVSENGESGPGVYLTDKREVADRYLKAKQAYSSAEVRTYTTDRSLVLLDRGKPGGEEEYRALQRDDRGKLRKGQEFIDVAKVAGYDGVIYPGTDGEREVVIHNPSVLVKEAA